jgi:hypothetical protein
MRPMRASFRETLSRLRELISHLRTVRACSRGLVYLAYSLLDPTPPKQITLATGQDQAPMPSSGAATRRS